MMDGSEILSLMLKFEGASLTASCQTTTAKPNPHAHVLYRQSSNPVLRACMSGRRQRESKKCGACVH